MGVINISLAQVHAAIAYYLVNQIDIDDDLATDAVAADALEQTPSSVIENSESNSVLL